MRRPAPRHPARKPQADRRNGVFRLRHLRTLVIPGGVQRVGTLAFAKCSQMERVRIEPGVAQLGPSCFSKCAALKRVEIPASVAQIGGGAFFGCSKELKLYGAEGVPAQQYARLNGLAFDSQSWKEDEELVLREEEDGTLTVMGARQAAPHRIANPDGNLRPPRGGDCAESVFRQRHIGAAGRGRRRSRNRRERVFWLPPAGQREL